MKINIVVGALEQLYALEALDDEGNLTKTGRQMSLFPVEPTLAKILIQSKKLKCTKEAIDIVSMLSVEPIFFSANDQREEANTTKRKFMSHDGDHITLLNVITEYQNNNGSSQWCLENFVNQRSMRQIIDIRKQLIQFCTKHDIDPKQSSLQDPEIIIKCFLSGFFKNVAIR
jgi:HrpA-like RNA helicase